MPSLQRRLLLGTALGAAAVLLLANLALYAMLRSSLVAEFDRALLDKAATLASMVEQDGDETDLEFINKDLPEFERSSRPEYFQVRQADGTIVGKSASLNFHTLPLAGHSPTAPTIRALTLPDGRTGRTVILPFQSRVDEEAETGTVPAPLTLTLARDVLDVDAKLARAGLVLAIVGTLTVFVTLSVLAWLVRLGLKPVHGIAQEIAAIDERRLGDRLDPARTPRELRPIVQRLNELLHRLDAVLAREKGMTADVAHELRTPLAGLRATLEVAISRDRPAASYRESMTDCLGICRQTQTLVENLLALARLDAGGEPVRREKTDLGVLLQATWTPFQRIASERGLNLRWDVEPGLFADTDSAKLQTILNNLFENAVHYADAGGRVEISAARHNGSVQVAVCNTGSGISRDQLPHVFERFWRGDLARKNPGRHSGLGLSICRNLVHHLGGDIAAESQAGGVFRIVVTV